MAVPCPLCGGPLEGLSGQPRFCPRCLERLDLDRRGVRGTTPLPFPWWAAGSYAGPLRSVLLDLKRRPRGAVVDALIEGLEGDAAGNGNALLTPIPSWRQRGNGLPSMLCARLARKLRLMPVSLLVHRHPVLGQHHLGHRLREENQRGAFRCRNGPAGRRREVILVDDILTSGATLMSAAAALGTAGWRIRGALCLARTPRRGERRRGQ